MKHPTFIEGVGIALLALFAHVSKLCTSLSPTMKNLQLRSN